MQERQVELYGKCRELGYCDCGGFHGCIDYNGPGHHAMKDERVAKELPEPKDAWVDPVPPYKLGQAEADREAELAMSQRVGGEAVEEINWGDGEVPRSKIDDEPKTKDAGDPECTYCRRRGEACVRHGGTVTNRYHQPKTPQPRLVKPSPKRAAQPDEPKNQPAETPVVKSHHDEIEILLPDLHIIIRRGRSA